MQSPDSSLLNKIEANINGAGTLQQEYRDFILKKEIYHCTQKELEEQNEYYLDLDFSILMLERKQEAKERKRAEQSSK